MIPLRRHRAIVQSVSWPVLALLIACLMAESAAAQTAMEVANQRRAQLAQNSAALRSSGPNPSNLGAISAAVDAEVDRRANPDKQSDLFDPSLSPLRLLAPNRNGEDDSSIETQPATLTPSNGAHTKYSGATARPLYSYSSDGPHSAGRQNAFVSKQQSPASSRNTLHPSIQHSATAWGAPPISNAQGNLGSTRIHGNTYASLHKSRQQQETYARNCSKLYLSALQCRATFRQQRTSANRTDPAHAYHDSLETNR